MYTYLALIVYDALKGTIKKRFIHRDFFVNQFLKESRPDIPRFFKDVVSNSQIQYCTYIHDRLCVLFGAEKSNSLYHLRTVAVETPVYQLYQEVTDITDYI